MKPGEHRVDYLTFGFGAVGPFRRITEIRRKLDVSRSCIVCLMDGDVVVGNAALHPDQESVLLTGITSANGTKLNMKAALYEKSRMLYVDVERI